MCVICVGTTGNERPTRADLVVSCINNPDGFGWGIVYQDGASRAIESDHSMDADTAIDGYLSMLDLLGDDVLGHLFHARIATRGGVHLAGCHPFTVGDGSGSLLAHNGMLGLSIPKTDNRVDSQVFAEDVLPRFGGVAGLSDPYVWDVLDGYVTGQHSKVVILNTVYDEMPVIILGEHLGSWDKQSGLWWSNQSWKPRTTYAAPYTPASASVYSVKKEESMWEDYDTFDIPSEDELLALYGKKCILADCPEYVFQQDFGICNECGTCQVCNTHWRACNCDSYITR